MNNINTEVLTALTKGLYLKEVFRSQLEQAVNTLLETELTAFLNYDKYDPAGYLSGNSRNGTYKTISLCTVMPPLFRSEEILFKKMFQDKTNLLTFYQFPKQIRASIYTNNLSENLNKQIKRKTKIKECFPNERILDKTIYLFKSILAI